MTRNERHITRLRPSLSERLLVIALCVLLTLPGGWAKPAREPEDPLPAAEARTNPPAKAQTNPAVEVPTDSVAGLPDDREVFLDARVEVPVDSLPPTEVRADDYAYDDSGRRIFNPSPERAVWLSALCPGLGQIYNRRYWKLPIVIGGFMGLGYATNWNNTQYEDYMQGYRDLLDDDPQTKSYMDFFPPTVNEADLDHTWLEQTFKARKDYARRNRDLCIIGLVALYALCMLDAYVDASLTHFDVTPDLSLDWSPTLMAPAGGGNRPALGLNWAFTF